MKKVLFNGWLVCLCMALCTGFMACEDDDEDDNDNEYNTLIVGKWETTHNEGMEIEGDEEFTWDDDVSGEYSEFLADGTYIFSTDEGGSDMGRWSIDGNRITITDSYGARDVCTIEMLSATGAVLVYEEEYTDEDGYYYWYEKVTLRKISD